MIKNTAVYMMIALLAAVLGGMSCKTGEIDLGACRPLVTEADNDKEIQMKTGDTICVKLRAQLGTGFGWYVEKSSPLIKQLGSPMQMQEKKGEPGSVEFQVYQFTAQGSGKGELELFYKRPWVKNVPPEKTFKVRLAIQ
jgi:inhibitor of cysteine peptidase